VFQPEAMMTAGMSNAKLWLVRVVLPAALVIGVGLLVTRPPRPAAVPDEEPVGERLHKIGLALNEAATRLGRPPMDLSEVRPFLAEHGDPDHLLVSPRDGQPFRVFWDVDVRSVAYDTVLAHEQVGSGGTRFVLTATAVVQLTDAELNAAAFPAGHRR